MNIKVSTHQGQMYNEEVDYIVVKTKEGEFAILKNHVPVVCAIPDGTIKMVLDKQELYLAVQNGFLEFKNDEITVIAQGAHIGRFKESALKHLDKSIQDRLTINKKANADYAMKEKEIIDNLKQAKAGNL